MFFGNQFKKNKVEHVILQKYYIRLYKSEKRYENITFMHVIKCKSFAEWFDFKYSPLCLPGKNCTIFRRCNLSMKSSIEDIIF
jgi:hypothetical protein